ncbi:MAG: hypothetical protein KDA22_12710, partial [Phycisphaerales bacterium]|nr:hypothetical protein [Phycisphaerales bacterium]
MLQRLFVLLALALLVAVPLLARPAAESTAREARRLIIVTPHNEQIRAEFARAFDRWHTRNFGEPVAVVYSTPGGTSEIRRMLQAQYRSDLRAGRPVGGAADLVWGGGSYEFGELKKPIEVEAAGADGATEVRSTTVIEPIPFDPSFLRDVYGEENRIGDDPLFDPSLYWF